MKLKTALKTRWFYHVTMKRLEKKTRASVVKLVHWRPPIGRNFGDELSLVIVERLLAARNIRLDFQTKIPRRLLAIGSIMVKAQEGDTIWGTGVNGRNIAEEPSWQNLDVRAVRGPMSRDYLLSRRPSLQVPEIFGDPGLLLFNLFPELLARQTLPAYPERILLPNLNDLWQRHLPTDFDVISPLESWTYVVEHIVHAKEIFTSSLHGLVLGQSLGKDVKLVKFTNYEPLFKYEDYAYGAGLETLKVFDNLAAAKRVDMSGMVVRAPNRLAEAFPYDLWV